jgi:hypothetical protein
LPEAHWQQSCCSLRRHLRQRMKSNRNILLRRLLPHPPIGIFARCRGFPNTRSTTPAMQSRQTPVRRAGVLVAPGLPIRRPGAGRTTTLAGRADVGLAPVVPAVRSTDRASPVDPEVVVAGQADRMAIRVRRLTAIGMVPAGRAGMAAVLARTGHDSMGRCTAPTPK